MNFIGKKNKIHEMKNGFFFESQMISNQMQQKVSDTETKVPLLLIFHWQKNCNKKLIRR